MEISFLCQLEMDYGVFGVGLGQEEGNFGMAKMDQ